MGTLYHKRIDTMLYSFYMMLSIMNAMKIVKSLGLFFAVGALLLCSAPAQTNAQSVFYGVDIDETTGDVSGYAWNDGVGWIDFNAVTYNTTTGQLGGNADITGITAQGGDGQLSMSGDCTPSCAGYGVLVDLVTNQFSGSAWNNLIGWVEFSTAFSTITQDEDNNPSVVGYAWNDNIGWISMNNAATIPPSGTCDASLHNTCLWAWNDRIGWITHNSVDNPITPKYGVDVDDTTGAVSGFAWNDAGGWIDFAPTAGFPSLPNNGVQYNPATRELSGWAHITGYGANGWVKMRDTGAFPYGVSIAANGDFTGYAWSDSFGWFEFAPAGYTPVRFDNDIDPTVYGWAWNDAIGWISMAFTGYGIDYGVDVLPDGRVTGYAWSEIGWIQYDPAGTYPSGFTYSTRWDPISGQISGWARAIGMTGPWAGTSWIKMRSSAGDTIAYGVNLNRSTGLWSGHAWNDTFGWIEYSHPFGSVYTKFDATGPSAPILTEPLNCIDTYTVKPASPLTPTLDWSDYVAIDGSTQAAYQIQVDDDPLFGSTLIDQTVSSTASTYTVALGQMTYNVTYYWRVRVQSSESTWSEWGTTGVLGTETNCFRTPLHPAPVCNFTSTPATPVLNEETLFTDTTQLFGGASVAQWSWNFGDASTLIGSNPALHKNPTHTYVSLGDYTVTLSVNDSDGYACSIDIPFTVNQVLPDFDRVIPR